MKQHYFFFFSVLFWFLTKQEGISWGQEFRFNDDNKNYFLRIKKMFPKICQHSNSSNLIHFLLRNWVGYNSSGFISSRKLGLSSCLVAFQRLSPGWFLWMCYLLGEIKQLMRFVLNGSVNKVDIATGSLCFNDEAAKIKVFLKVCSTRR